MIPIMIIEPAATAKIGVRHPSGRCFSVSNTESKRQPNETAQPGFLETFVMVRR
jgi:hypothetical protein